MIVTPSGKTPIPAPPRSTTKQTVVVAAVPVPVQSVLSANLLPRNVVHKLNLQTCSQCGSHAGRDCKCGVFTQPWFGNTFVNDGHRNFPTLHQYFTLAALVANDPAVIVPVVYSFSAITRNTVSVSPATGFGVVDLADIGLISPTTAVAGQIPSKFGDLFLVSGLTGTDAIFNGEYRILRVPTTTNAYFVLQSLNGSDDCLAPRVNDLIRVWNGEYAGMFQITAITNGVYTLALAEGSSLNPVRMIRVVGCQTGNNNIVFE